MFKMGALKIAAAIISVIVVLAIVIIFFMAVGNVQSNNYCDNWYNALEAQEAQLGIFSDYDAFNREVSDYNRQCAY